MVPRRPPRVTSTCSQRRELRGPRGRLFWTLSSLEERGGGRTYTHRRGEGRGRGPSAVGRRHTQREREREAVLLSLCVRDAPTGEAQKTSRETGRAREEGETDRQTE